MDVNDDGHLDILSGSYSRMEQDMAGLFQVLYGEPGGGFAKAAVLTGTDGEPLIIEHAGREEVTKAICTRPFAVDWDGDGDLDLVVGNFEGTFHVFRGEGEGRFSPQSEPVLSGDARLSIPGAHSDPFVIDWDGDGDLDLLSGSNRGGVYLAENIAGEGKEPELRPFETLISAGEQPEYGAFLAEAELVGPTTSTRIWVDDVDGDGKLDVLVGDNVTLVAPAKGLSEEQSLAKRAEWNAEMTKLQEERVKADPHAQQALNEKFQALYERRSEFLDEQRTGYVWLYRGR